MRPSFRHGVCFAVLVAVLWGMGKPSYPADAFANPEMAGINRSAALNLANEGRFQEAIEKEEMALKEAQERYGPLHPSLVPVIDDLGALEDQMAEYDKAESQYKWALALLEKNFGLEDPRIAPSLDRLAALDEETGNFPEAELLEKRALSLRQGDPSTPPADLARTFLLLGSIEGDFEKRDLRLSFDQKAFETTQKTAVTDPDLYIQVMTSLAEASNAGNDFGQAESLLQKALETAQKNFPPDQVENSEALENLADFYRSRDQDGKARPLYQSALQIDQKFVGTYDQYPALPYIERLAQVDQDLGDLSAAEALLRKALAMEVRIFGPHHPRVALGLLGLARVQLGKGEKAPALDNLKRSLDILRLFFKDGHPLIGMVESLRDRISR